MTTQPISHDAPFRPNYVIPAGKALFVICELFQIPAGVTVYVTAIGPRMDGRAPEVEITPCGPHDRCKATLGEAALIAYASPGAPPKERSGRITHKSQIAFTVTPLAPASDGVPTGDCEIQILIYAFDETDGQDLIKRRLWSEEKPEFLRNEKLDPTMVAAGEFIDHPYQNTRGDTMFKATLKKTGTNPPAYVIFGECDDPELKLLVISEPMPPLPDDEPQQETVLLSDVLETNGAFEIPFSTKDTKGRVREDWTILITSPAGAFPTIRLETFDADLAAIDADDLHDPDRTAVTENPYAAEGNPTRTLPGGLEVSPAFQQELGDDDDDDGDVFHQSADPSEVVGVPDFPDTDPGEDALLGDPADLGKSFPDRSAKEEVVGLPDEDITLPEPPSDAPPAAAAPTRGRVTLPPKHRPNVRVITPEVATASISSATTRPVPRPEAAATAKATESRFGWPRGTVMAILGIAALVGAFFTAGMVVVFLLIDSPNGPEPDETAIEVDERASVPAVKATKAEPVQVRTCEPHDLTGIGQANPRFFARKASEKPWNLWFSLQCEDGKIRLGHKDKKPQDGRSWRTTDLVPYPPSP